MARGFWHWRTATSLREHGWDERSFQTFMALVDRLFYTCVGALAFCVATLLMP